MTTASHLPYVLVVLHKTDASFAYYDVESGKAPAVILTRPFPHEACLSPDRRRLYIAEMGIRGVESTEPGGHTAAVFDTRSGASLSSINLLPHDRPHGLATHGNHLFITSEFTQHLLIFDLLSETLLHAVALGQKGAHMTAVSPDGEFVYTANLFSNTISEIRVADGRLMRHIQVLERPEGMAFSRDGRLIFVVNRESAAVSVVDRTVGKQTAVIATGNGPVRIASTPDGQKLIVPLFHQAAVQVIDAEQQRVIVTHSVGQHPAGVALSPDGRLAFISCEDENLIYVFAIQTFALLKTIATGPGCDSMICLRADEVCLPNNE